MEISSRTPEGWPNRCPVCGHAIKITPSPRTFDAPCPHCGHLLWFADPTRLTPLWSRGAHIDATASYALPPEIKIAPHVLRLIPEVMARENRILPLLESADVLVIAAAVPIDVETIDKVQFILNRRVLVVPTNRDWIDEQHDNHYGTRPDDADSP